MAQVNDNAAAHPCAGHLFAAKHLQSMPVHAQAPLPVINPEHEQ
jgi:hypothetical protein